jgi:hypothetical protein
MQRSEAGDHLSIELRRETRTGETPGKVGWVQKREPKGYCHRQGSVQGEKHLQPVSDNSISSPSPTTLRNVSDERQTSVSLISFPAQYFQVTFMVEFDVVCFYHKRKLGILLGGVSKGQERVEHIPCLGHRARSNLGDRLLKQKNHTESILSKDNAGY